MHSNPDADEVLKNIEALEKQSSASNATAPLKKKGPQGTSQLPASPVNKATQRLNPGLSPAARANIQAARSETESTNNGRFFLIGLALFGLIMISYSLFTRESVKIISPRPNESLAADNISFSWSSKKEHPSYVIEVYDVQDKNLLLRLITRSETKCELAPEQKMKFKQGHTYQFALMANPDVNQSTFRILVQSFSINKEAEAAKKLLEAKPTPVPTPIPTPLPTSPPLPSKNDKTPLVLF